MSVQPDPEVWPQCSACDVPYILRRGFRIGGPSMWLWQRDCKHKTAEPVVMNADGPVQS